MCGIIATSTTTTHARLARSVAHRGTFAPVVQDLGAWRFCHALMPVQGAAPVLQPLTTGSHALLFQGELWEHKGYASDTEYLFDVLRAAPPQGMPQTVAGLYGMFAFVFADNAAGLLWFASDVFAEQPLYYAHQAGAGFFASLTVGSEHKQLRACGVAVKDIKPCLPGVLYCYNAGTKKLEEVAYHKFDYGRQRTTEVDHAYIRKQVARSCKAKYKAVSLQKCALLLSGGVDSAIMAYELGRLGLDKAFTVSTDPDSVDFKTAEVTAARHGFKLTKVLCKTLDPDLSIAMAESKNKSIVEEYVCHLALAKCLAERDYRVVFTGSGADELFCGYPYYLRFVSRKDPASMAGMQEKLVEGYHRLELRTLNKVYMSQAIECRSPFLDATLADYAMGLDVQECLVGKGAVMKKALRDAYEGRIDSAHNPKIIAGRSMGVIDYFAAKHGGDARAYHQRYRDIWASNSELFALVRRCRDVEFEIID